MCKIFGVTNLTKIPKAQLDAVLKHARDLVTEANRDGFGFSLSYKSSVYSEKFVNPADFKGLGVSSLHEKMDVALFSYEGSISYGTETTKEAGQPLALVAHGRTSTNYKGHAEYSHPFVNMQSEEAFVHNGVVDIPKGHAFKLETRNDSEWLANQYWKKGIAGMSEVTGYYAFFNLKKNGVFEIVKDDVAQLYGAYSSTIDGYIFGTTESMISRFALQFQFEITAILPIADLVHSTVRLNKVTAFNHFVKAKKKKALTAQERAAFKDYKTDWSNDTAYLHRDDYSSDEYWGGKGEFSHGTWKSEATKKLDSYSTESRIEAINKAAGHKAKK